MLTHAVTDRAFLRDSYLFQMDAEIVRILDNGAQWGLVLDRTIFHPQGG
jgi:Ser-tRNA(Ala) deacylase AlaX